ncbi:4-carboxymuconolactone decarboxylase [Neokomagataea thailandica NBRC 106555]|uniref:Carboxymuconolactone decarboxylase family protein n=2 Tax=Neokomagataea TaxID=1223423 RepID=A0A4Y6V9L8_9PROT|nr:MULTISPECIES: carboxymuconolactone decarboxylase family protein [Neokomagataea]QDH25055.1 carboxymuconolactone decarboxylase family protein [Neokomagataea tanensis]GBR51354.1 4-carboxymuconolactone decarboxylase [Neokomagataea thailandica NBRC 106555]
MSKTENGEKILSILNPGAAEQVKALLNDIAPDFAKIFVEFPFGTIYARENLDLRSREIATLAALVTKGTAPGEIKTHIVCALNAGLTREEIVEIIMQMAVYAGFPEAISGLALAKEVFTELDAQ